MATTQNTQHKLVYNGIELLLSKFDAWDMENIYSDDGTTRLYTKHYISIRGWINAAAQSYPFTNNAVTIQQYRTRLLEPRQGLTVYVNGVVSLNIDPINPFGQDGAVDYNRGPGDAKQGPSPKTVKVMEWYGTTLMVEFAVEVYEYPCAVGSPTLYDAIIYNRWTQIQDIDQDGMSTITSRGQLKVRTDIIPMADTLRGIPLPVITISKTFRRESQKYEISSDGSTLTWEVIDKEQYRPAGKIKDINENDNQAQNITRWTGTWTEEGSMETGVGFVISGTLNITAWGAKATDKDHIMLFLARISNCRLEEGDIIRYYRFEEGLSENYISMTMSVLIFRENKNVNMLGSAAMAPAARMPMAKSASKSLSNQSLTRIGGPVNYINPWVRNEIEGGDPMPIKIRGNDIPINMVENISYRNILLFISASLPTCDHRTDVWLHSQNPTSPLSPNINIQPSPIGGYEEKGYQGLSLNSDTQTKQSEKPYISSRISTQIIENSNEIQLARANGNTSQNCFYAKPTVALSKKIVRFVMSRLNQAPDLPKPQITGHTLLKNTVIMDEIEVLPSGVDFIYTIRGEYIFGMDKTAEIGLNTIKMPSSIISTNNVSSSNNNISANNFVPNLIA